jgi:hypothetical protein
MRKCNFEGLIDNYLLNRLDEDKKKKFEEHYFNCPYCFEKIVERDKLISVIKYKGDMIFQDEYVVEEAKGATWFEKIVSLLTPQQWAVAAVSACLLLTITYAVIFVIMPNFKTTAPPFVPPDPFVRGGERIILISPIYCSKGVPSKFEWQKSDKVVEYKIYIYDNGDQLWSATTKENFIVLPEEVKRRMTLGEKYSWEVKAFSPRGTFIAFSGKTQFKIIRPE